MKRYLMVFLVAALFGSLSGVSFNIGYSLGYRNGAEEQESLDKLAAVMELTKQIGEETRSAREKFDVFLKALEEKADEVKAQEEAPELIDIGDAGERIKEPESKSKPPEPSSKPAIGELSEKKLTPEELKRKQEELQRRLDSLRGVLKMLERMKEEDQSGETKPPAESQRRKEELQRRLDNLKMDLSDHQKESLRKVRLAEA